MMNKNFNKYLTIIALLTMVVIVSGCIGSSVERLNDMIPEINDNILKGDTYFNSAAKEYNNKEYDSANEILDDAIKEYTNAENKLKEASEIINKTNDTVFINYIDLSNKEVTSKKEACEKFKVVCDLAKNKEYTGQSQYISKINKLMSDAIDYHNEREILSDKYSNKFKEENI